jgi:hypothetical protein
LPPDAEPAKQPDEVRVVRLVEDNEPGVHRVGPLSKGDVDRVGVTADVILCLVDGKVVIFV